MSDVVFVYSTWPDAETAEAAGRAAVEAGLAACANIGAPITSVYRWEGVMERAIETPMWLKTTQGAVEGLSGLLVELHPYDVPAVVALPVQAEGSHQAFLQWVATECVGSPGKR